MYKVGIPDFKYFVGIESLADVATPEDKVCVLNIMGSESKVVTPVSHAFSGGNVVCGTSPGRQGTVLKTPVGEIPVFDNVRAALNAGHKFNVGVIYLPPSGVRDAVAELVRVNRYIEKIVIITEKVAVHDAREIRAMCQARGVDVFGANCLGIADSWNHIRIGSAIGGNAPEEVLHKGSIAIYSNSGNFTNTMATYLQMSGWGTTTLISSGKDVYIHYGASEFQYALENDDRSKAAVMYIEPGGYYEQGLRFNKPVVACVVGRWKSRLTRAVGHAGALAGSGDDAEAKERWLMDAVGVEGLYSAEVPIVSKSGAVVTDIADIPKALTEVMKLNGIEPDFAPDGSLSLKSWFANTQGLNLPDHLDLPIAQAPEPYATRIRELDEQVGAAYPRQSMKDSSGASVMDPTTQITSLYNVSLLRAAGHSLEENIGLALTHALPDKNEAALITQVIAAQVNLHDTPALSAAEASRLAGNAPNLVLASAVALQGPNVVKKQTAVAASLLSMFAKPNANLAHVKQMANIDQKLFVSDKKDNRAEQLLAAVTSRGIESIFIDFIRSLDGHPTWDAVLGAMAAQIGWRSVMRKRISARSVINLPWHLMLMATQIGAAVKADAHCEQSFQGVPMDKILTEMHLTELAYLALMGESGCPSSLISFQVLVGLLITNGPGSISAQGAKGAVSSDGPETPERIQLNKGVMGYLTHSGFAHGGNGYEGIAFLVQQFSKTNLADPSDQNHDLDLQQMADSFSLSYAKEKAAAKEVGNSARAIPGINHPVFKNKPVNIDPREAFIKKFFDERGEYNVFQEFYHRLVERLYENGVTRNVFCVNIDAVIATSLLKLFWPRYRAGQISDREMEAAAFTIFLFGRMVGCAAEIDDHLNRGRNMDTRTAASKCRYVS